MVGSFLLWPDVRLSRPADPVAGIDDEVLRIWDGMLEAMYAMPGIGLAAPQLGIMRCLAVVDCSERADAPIRFANPEIIETSDVLESYPEASPNLPGVNAEVRRPDAVRVAYMDETGTRKERDMTGLWARSIQHQIDHLHGKVFVDRLAPVKRRLVLSRFRKLQRRG